MNYIKEKVDSWVNWFEEEAHLEEIISKRDAIVLNLEATEMSGKVEDFLYSITSHQYILIPVTIAVFFAGASVAALAIKITLYVTGTVLLALLAVSNIYFLALKIREQPTTREYRENLQQQLKKLNNILAAH